MKDLFTKEVKKPEFSMERAILYFKKIEEGRGVMVEDILRRLNIESLENVTRHEIGLICYELLKRFQYRFTYPSIRVSDRSSEDDTEEYFRSNL